MGMKKEIKLIFIIFVLNLIKNGFCDMNAFECPIGWKEFKDHCYRFIMEPENSDGVKNRCQEDEAYSLSINSQEEHNFISDALNTIDQSSIKSKWWTSGLRMSINRTQFFWEGDGTKIESYVFWKDPSIPSQMDKNRIIYDYDGIKSQWAWILGKNNEIQPFICEISKEDIYKISNEDRGPDYGSNEPDFAKIERGPKFIEQPVDTTYEDPKSEQEEEDEGDISTNPGGIRRMEFTVLECIVDAVPQAKYKWFKMSSDNNVIELKPENDARYSIINGRLIINKPKPDKDEAKYQCNAGNPYGIILSNIVDLKFGFLQNFPKSPRTAITVKSYDSVSIACMPPEHSPPILYAWYKNSIANFVRTNFKPYLFVSYDGLLYFSEVTVDDKGSYYCMVYKPGWLAQGKISMPTPLIVTESSAATYEPKILSGFPKLFPSTPMVGGQVRFECFARGSARPGKQLEYRWHRLSSLEDNAKILPLPKNAVVSDHNRVIVIENVQIYDSGIYRCTVERLTGKAESKTITLHVLAQPYFITPLKDKYIDSGTTLNWRCIAGGSSEVQYVWHKNGVAIKNGNGLTVENTVLKIDSANAEKHNGMYQCRATSVHGIRYSTAELRVISFPPNFNKYPMKPNMYATLKGNATLICKPESAPYPTPENINWFKNNRPLPLNDNIRKMPNGNLIITNLKQTDGGFYECKVENEFGKASTKGNLTILKTTAIIHTPEDETVRVNRTRFLHCIASHAPQLDISYVWFQGPYLIEFERIYQLTEMEFQIWRNPHFKRGRGVYMGGLYIMQAHREHEGRYTCRVESSAGNFESSAYLRVESPPSMPVSLRVVTGSVTAFEAKLQWKEALRNGGKPVQTFALEALNKRENFWKVIRTNIRADRVEDPKTSTKVYEIKIENLRPYSKYLFRMRSESSVGTSEPSLPSKEIETLQTKPDLAPEEVGGGGGKVGTLLVTWKPLSPWQHNGEGLYYVAYRRKLNDEEFKESPRLFNPKQGHYTFEVGWKNFYLEYEVQVQACNRIGCGPKSSIVKIYSSMGLPQVTPEDVRAQPFNATACLVHWIPAPENREKMRGKLGGYRVSYWKARTNLEEGAPRITINGQADQALVIGLDPDTMYVFDVMVWNEAGNGPKSQEFPQRTLRNSPINQPTEVNLLKLDDYTIDVYWRGVQTDQREEPLEGYKVRIWRVGTNIKVADDYDAGRETELRIRSLNPLAVYKLRVFGYSRGGDGTMSSPALKFQLGSASHFKPSFIFIVLLTICVKLFSN